MRNVFVDVVEHQFQVIVALTAILVASSLRAEETWNSVFLMCIQVRKANFVRGVIEPG